MKNALLPSLCLIGSLLCANMHGATNPDMLRKNYRLNPGDVISMQVFQEPELEKEIRVDGEGLIALPLIGTVQAEGKTLLEIQREVERRYEKDYLVNPQVTLLILEYTPRRVQVLGQVNDPGFVRIPPERQLTLTQAISGAKGFNLRAKSGSVQIRRYNQTKKKTEVIDMDVKQIFENPKAKDPVVNDGDLIFVPESTF